ncbi:MAG: CRTAC1 family protein [Pirellulaceae bacterium]
MAPGQRVPVTSSPHGNRTTRRRLLVLAAVMTAVAAVVIARWASRPESARPSAASPERDPIAAIHAPAESGSDRLPQSPPVTPGRDVEDHSADEGEAAPAVDDDLMPADMDQGPIVLHEVTPETGITFRHTDGSSGRLFIVETVASGLATLDYDLDGLLDIYFVNGGALPGTTFQEPPSNRLYRNVGEWRFVDVTEVAGVGDARHGLGATVGDFDNDGYPDLYVSNLGYNVMYRNNGDGSFDEVTSQTRTAVADAVRAGAGVCFLDSDGDGDLDLFVANYLKFSPDQPVTHIFRGKPIYAGPERYPPYASVLLRNNGDSTFSDVSEECGVGQHLGFGMGIVCGDFNQDGATDVFVGNDGGPGNFIFLNQGNGVFEEMGVRSGAAYSGLGLAHGSMGSDCGDYDNDGLMDLFVTSYQRQLATLFRNQGGGTFVDVTQQTGAGLGSFNQVTWGCGLADFDNDGRRDIFYASGHLIDNIDALDDSTSYRAAPVLLRNTPEGRFQNVSETAGSGLRKKSVGRGVAIDDLDNDGDLDVVILNSRQTSTVLRNDSVSPHHWLQIRLIGTVSNRDAVGAVVSVEAGGQRQFAEVRSGRGFQSHYGTILHFGLGQGDRADQIEVRWPSGGTESLEDVSADARITIFEQSD